MHIPIDPLLHDPDMRTIQIGGINFEYAHLVWINPERLKKYDHYRLLGSSRRADAKEAARIYWAMKAHFQSEIWQRCLTGEFKVLALLNSSEGGYELIAPAVLKEEWPDGPRLDPRYEKIELLGPTPRWLRISFGNESTLKDWIFPEFRCTDDYHVVVIRNIRFELGAAQSGIIRALHRASFRKDTSVFEEDIRAQVAFLGSIPDLFRRQPKWPELIYKVAKCRYRLNLRSEPDWTDWEDTIWARAAEIKAGNVS